MANLKSMVLMLGYPSSSKTVGRGFESLCPAKKLNKISKVDKSHLGAFSFCVLRRGTWRGMIKELNKRQQLSLEKEN